MCRNHWPTSAVGGTYPTEGNRCHVVANTTTRAMATTNAGTDMKTAQTTVMARSITPPRRTAAVTPSTVPITAANTIATTARDTSMGSRWPMLVATGM